MQDNQALNKKTQKLNIVFAGTPDFAAQLLKILINNHNFNICAVYTQPDRPAGRGRHLTPSEVKQVILNSKLNINIEQPETLRNPQVIKSIKSYAPDLIIVVAYGLILPAEILNIPNYGCINIHTSLLPRWRGAAPIQRAILEGDQETGISIQQMDTGLDTGPIISATKCTIMPSDNTITLTNKLLELAKPLLLNTLENINNLDTIEIQNNNLATYAHKIDKSEANINWELDAINIDRKIRAFNPWPIAQTNLKNNDLQPILIKILEAKIINNHNPNILPGSIVKNNNKSIIIQTGHSQLEIVKLKFSGGNIITSKDALNGKYNNLLTAGNVLI